MRVFTRRKVFLPLIAAAVALGITAAVALANVTLASHTGEVGATWTQHGSSASAAEVVTATGMVRPTTASAASMYYASGAPTNANYKVEADIKVVSQPTTTEGGVMGRVNTAANTFYGCRWIHAPSTDLYQLIKYVSGVGTTIQASATETHTNGDVVHLELNMNGTSLACKADGVTKASGTDSAITAAGKAGIRTYSSTVGDSAGIHLDNFTATDL